MAAEALRPLRLGQLLDRTFSLYRRNFLLFIGLSTIPVVILCAMSVVMQIAQGPALQAQVAHRPADPAQALAAMQASSSLLLPLIVVSMAAFALAHGALTFATSQVYLGRSATIGALYRAARVRFWRIFGLWLLIFLRAIGYCALVGVVAAIVGGVAAFAARGAGAVVVAPVVVGGIIVMVLIFLRYSLATAVLLLENTGMNAAIRRSISLMRGHRFRAFVIFLTVVAVSYAGFILFGGPFLAAQTYYITQGIVPPLWLRALGAVVGGLSQLLLMPFGVMVFVLLYFDIRVRKEGLDLQMMIGSLGGPAGAEGVPAVPAPPGDLPAPPPPRTPGSLGL